MILLESSFQIVTCGWLRCLLNGPSPLCGFCATRACPPWAAHQTLPCRAWSLPCSYESGVTGSDQCDLRGRIFFSNSGRSCHSSCLGCCPVKDDDSAVGGPTPPKGKPRDQSRPAGLTPLSQCEPMMELPASRCIDMWDELCPPWFCQVYLGSLYSPESSQTHAQCILAHKSFSIWPIFQCERGKKKKISDWFLKHILQ